MAGVECCCSNRPVRPGLTEPAGRGTWWGRSGQIKCCLQIAQRRRRERTGQGRHTAGSKGRAHTKHTRNGQMTHPSPPRHLHRQPSTHNHTERQTGKAVRSVRARSLLQHRPTCNQAYEHTHTCTSMHKHRDGVTSG